MKKLLTLGILLFTFCQFAVAGTDDAVKQVRKNAEDILKILNEDNGHNSAEIRNKAETYAIPYFDFQRMTALAIGAPWRQATSQQKIDLANAFKDKLISIYSGTMLQYKSAKVDIKDKPIVTNNGRVVIIDSIISPSDQQAVRINYVMYENKGMYRIYDVKVEGQSLVTIYRNQFGEIIRKKGIDGLIDELRKDALKKE